MAAFFIFLLALILIIFFSVLSFGLSILRGIWGLFFPGKRHNRSFAGNAHNYTGHEDFGPQSNDNCRKERNKIFDRNEGEYVDFEEVSK